MFEHQRVGVGWLHDRPRACLFDEPGLGKSRVALEAAVEPVLVVAPAMVLDSGTWEDEIQKWTSGLDVECAPYSMLTQRERTRNGGSRPLPILREEWTRRDWGTVILDESQYLKNRRAYWTRAFLRLAPKLARVYQLTGTPIPNWAHEAFVSLQLAWPEKTAKGLELGSYWRWADEWFEVGPTRWSPMDVGDLRGDRTWDSFREANWDGRMLLRRREECLDLPPLTKQRWNVKMAPAQARAYKELRRDFITWLDAGERGEQEIVAWNSGAKLVKLLKCATGLESLEPGAKGSGKLRALEAILEDRPRPTLVVAHFRSSVAACAQAARSVGAEVQIVDGSLNKRERREAVRAFQSGGLAVLCATLDTISEGLNLQAADQVVFVERSWRPSRNEQALRRLHRVGQMRPVTAIDLVTRGTVDERVLRLLAAKTDQAMRALGIEDLRALA